MTNDKLPLPEFVEEFLKADIWKVCVIFWACFNISLMPSQIDERPGQDEVVLTRTFGNET
jgi:hypothetical protein